MQVSELCRYCEARGWEIGGQYVDTISGTKSSRPQRDRLMRDCENRRIDIVICWKLDRWGRSIADSVVTLERLASVGVRFISITQGIDSDQDSAVGRALLGLLCVFSEFERALIIERVRSGINRYQDNLKNGRARSKSGKNLPIGRPRVIFRVDEAQRLRESGMSWRKIAKALNVPEATIRARCAENLKAISPNGDCKRSCSAA